MKTDHLKIAMVVAAFLFALPYLIESVKFVNEATLTSAYLRVMRVTDLLNRGTHGIQHAFLLVVFIYTALLIYGRRLGLEEQVKQEDRVKRNIRMIRGLRQ